MIRSLSEFMLLVGRSIELSILVKATLAIVAGLAAAGMARRGKASTRHLILASTFAALIVVPVATMIVPSVGIAVPVASGAASRSLPTTSQPASSTSTPAPVERSPIATVTPWFPAWSTIARVGWASGSTIVLLWLAAAAWRFGRLRRRGLPWPESRPLVAALAASAGIRGRVDVLLHENLVAPATCGWGHPAILLPLDARAWSEADVRCALVHELEHVRRGDWAIHLTARTVCGALWFHPLVWIALRRLCLEAERACDDAVLQSAEETDYADQLVQLARRLSNAPDHPALAMASRRDLSTRVSAILDSTQPRGRPGVLHAAAVVIVAVVLAAAVAPVRAVAVPSAVPAAGAAQSVTTARVERRRVSALDRSLYEAAEEGDVNDITALVAAGAHINAAIDADGSPLIAAARSGHLAAVRLLLDYGADPNMGVPGDGNPIIMAAAEGHTPVVELLLNRGASIDQIVPGDENPLIQASGEGHLQVVKLLVARGANVNARVWVDEVGDRAGEWRTPLTMARRGRHDAVVTFLLSSGAVAVASPPPAGVPAVAQDQASVAAKEAKLAECLLVLRVAIDRYYASRKEYPPTLDALVKSGDLRLMPEDPFTNSRSTWRIVAFPPGRSNPTADSRVFDIRSGADGTALDGTRYSDW